MVDSLKLMNAANAYKTMSAQQLGQSSALVPISDGRGKAGESAFSALVGESVQKAATTIKAGETMAVKGLLNETTMADLATAVTDAELTLKTVVSVRDRIISAYQDIIKMPI